MSGEREQDEAPCVQLWVTSIRHRDAGAGPGERAVAERARSKFTQPIVRFAVAREGDISGFALTVADSDRPHDEAVVLELLAVEPRSAGAGIGRALLEDAISASRRAGFAAIRLSVRTGNRRAISLYEVAGFTREGAPLDHPLGGEPMVTYVLALDSRTGSTATEI
jgi:ribosomal protein S18 acetylase RimI-like enzyme